MHHLPYKWCQLVRLDELRKKKDINVTPMLTLTPVPVLVLADEVLLLNLSG